MKIISHTSYVLSFGERFKIADISFKRFYIAFPKGCFKSKKKTKALTTKKKTTQNKI